MKQVRKFLELSTVNLPQETAQAIEAGTFGKKPIMSNEHGWLFHVPSAPGWLPDAVTCVHFIAIMSLAIDAGCDYVLFDKDVEPVDWLPAFEW